MINDP